MAFTRKAVSAIEGITPAQVDAIMTLHGTSMADYMPKSELDAKVQEALKEKVGDLDIENLKAQAAKAEQLEKDYATLQLSHALETRLIKDGAVNTKAVIALLDQSKLKIEGDELKGYDEQIAALKEKEKWAFVSETTPTTTGMEHKPGGEGEQTLADAITSKMFPQK